jgi:hypothetical protein
MVPEWEQLLEQTGNWLVATPDSVLAKGSLHKLDSTTRWQFDKLTAVAGHPE